MRRCLLNIYKVKIHMKVCTPYNFLFKLFHLELPAIKCHQTNPLNLYFSKIIWLRMNFDRVKASIRGVN